MCHHTNEINIHVSILQKGKVAKLGETHCADMYTCMYTSRKTQSSFDEWE